MLSKRNLTFFLALSICSAGISCKKTPASAGLDSHALMNIVRAYNTSSQPGNVLAASRLPEPPKVSPEKLQTEFDYVSTIKQYFIQGNYDQLEKAIKEAREGKGRVLGGTWKVAEFYTAIYTTFIGPNSDESDWKMAFESLNKWIAAKPESAAARISLAEAYVGYAWVARGHGYASTVTEKGWDLFRERVGLASSALVDAAHLKEKCPYWYEEMQTVALAQGWDKTEARELMEQAVAFEPDFYHFYREHANSLQTKWYGDEGELESFAAEVSDRVGGEKGDILYFEITSLEACQCDAEKDVLQNMSWQRIKRGYSALELMYGVSSLKRNRFASMAVKANDKDAAHNAFSAIGTEWNKEVWNNEAQFEGARNWAMSE